MNKLSIRYNYHDSGIDSIYIDERDVRVKIELYGIYYPSEPIVEIRFLKISNHEDVKKYFQEILERAGSNRDIGCRVDAIVLDKKKKSKSGSLYISFRSAWLGKLIIRCKSFEEVETKKR